MPFDLGKDIVFRLENPDAADAALLKDAGVSAISESEIQSLNLPEHGGGLWPGITRPAAVRGRGDETASASREPWVDSNGYKIGWLRALHPNRPPVLHYKPDKLGDRAVPYDSLELALIEAWVAGGNYILAMEPNYREALNRKDAKAIAAWQQLGRTSRWLRENIALFRQPTVPIVTAIVDAGPASAEIANLLYRRNASPSLSVTVPTPDPQRRLAVVAANLNAPPPELMSRVLAHAEQGAAVVTTVAPAGMKEVKSEQDRVFYALGKGQVVAYKKPVVDPSEFALDVIDIVTHKRRAVRMWNAPSVIALATASPKPGERLVHLINYGSPVDMDIQTRVQGHYASAMLLRPDGSPLKLQAAKRATMTEVQVPELKRLGVVVFS